MKERKPYIWGCDFDPNPDIDGIRRKLRVVIQNEGKTLNCGPYDIYKEHQHLFASRSRDEDEIFAGKYPCPSWISATPDFKEEIYPETYRKFINEGGCLDFATAFGEHIVSETPTDRIPVTLGVDHCLTGGVYRAVTKAETESGSDVFLVILDKHLDAISPYSRNQMVGYQMEQNKKKRRADNGYEYHGSSFRGNYDTGSFLHYLIEWNTLQPLHLFVLGNQDSPIAKLRNLDDDRITDYLREYDALIEKGAVVKTLKECRKQSFRANHPELAGSLAGHSVYLSIDTDIFSDVLGQNARYNTYNGANHEEVLELLEWLGLGDSKLVGMDIMEIDINRVKIQFADEERIAEAIDDLIRGTLFVL